MQDLTVIYITANVISENFRNNMWANLKHVLPIDVPIITVSQKPMELGDVNLVFEGERSHLNIYRQALMGVKEAKTKYVAIVEDDILYSDEHFKYRPTRNNIFAYNLCCWSIFTWSDPPVFNYTGRRNHGMLICTRDAYINALEERFAKFPDDSQVKTELWAEPGKYERQLGVTIQSFEPFFTHPPNIMFTHPGGLSHETLGFKKRQGKLRAFDIPFWGKAEEVVKLYV